MAGLNFALTKYVQVFRAGPKELPEGLPEWSTCHGVPHTLGTTPPCAATVQACLSG